MRTPQLIESIDNANLMENMQMWPVFLKLLSDPADGIQIGATWIVGTAVQNNDKAQMVVLRHGFLHALLGLLEQSPSAAVRSKVAYALSGILKNNPAAIRALDDPSPSTSSGWASLTRALQDPSLQLRRKITFLMFNLLLQDVEPHEEEAELKAPSSNYSPVAPTPSKSSLTPASKSTALALTAHSSSPAPSADPSAPLERGPATSGISYPDVPLRLAKAGGIQVLASSLLPPGGVSSLPSGAYLSVKGAGPGADQQPRLDDDYAEKAVRVLALFSQNVSQRKSESVRAAIASTLFTKPLLTSAVTTLSEASPAGGDGPWHQALGIEPEDWLTFQRSVGNF